jgi:hypothetical protein
VLSKNTSNGRSRRLFPTQIDINALSQTINVGRYKRSGAAIGLQESIEAPLSLFKVEQSKYSYDSAHDEDFDED